MAEIPDIYSDQVATYMSTWGLSISFNATNVPTVAPGAVEGTIEIVGEQKAIVRMSLQHAKGFIMVLRRSLKQWEQTNGEILIPEGVYGSLGLTPEEW